jgi:hypothetical protein
MRRCERCILPESLPSVVLDENGVCSHCRKYDALFGDWEVTKAQRKREFEDLLMQARQLNRPYDCLIPLSGGKDSTYALYTCSKVYGLRSLCVTFDNGFLTEQARTNIRNALDATGADHLFYSINRDHLLGLYRQCLVRSGEFCFVCMRGIAVATGRAAAAFNVPLIVNGSGRRVAYLSMAPEVFQSGDHTTFRNILGGEVAGWDSTSVLGASFSPGHREGPSHRQVGLRATASRFLRLARRAVDRSLRIVEPPVSNTAVNIALFDYLDVRPEQVIQTLKAEMGWANPPGQLEHMDCALHEMPFYIHTQKFPELTMHTFHRSGLIRRGLMGREEALLAEEEEMATSAAPSALEPFLEEIGLSEAEFEDAVQDWRQIEQFRRTT